MIYIILLSFFLTACSYHGHSTDSQDPQIITLDARTKDLKLQSINLIDRNGLTETISAKERLKSFESTDFLSSQPYTKVLRVFAKDKQGKVFSVITSYYPTGQLKQYLEIENGRAHGPYIEWHSNGAKKLEAYVLGGSPDIDEKSQVGWSFDGKSFTYSDEGVILADITYSKGNLDETARYFHPNGTLAETIPYHKGEIHGMVEAFNSDGVMTEQTAYRHGLKDGESRGFYAKEIPAYKEQWEKGLLQEGSYYDRSFSEICTVQNGSGKRALFSDSGVSEIQEYKAGKPEGEVVLFDDKGTIQRLLHVTDGQKHGEEILYWPQTQNPKLSIEWYQGKIQGLVKTWYPEGSQESQREMNNNAKQGMLMSWYRNGELMLIEEYENDRLVRGDYLKKSNTTPVSKIVDGKGTATFYDADGTFLKRVVYKDGKPIDDESSHPL